MQQLEREKRRHKSKQPDLDPMVLQKLKFRRKCQFRACARLVYQNAYWLQEDIDYEGLDDIKKIVAQAVSKTKEKRLLKINDKILLNKRASERTEAEKKYIFRIIGGLKCFNRYPNHVKKKLAGVTYFKYYGPNRVIIREKHEAYAMYFIVTGDVAVSHLVYDDLLREYQSVELKVLHAGEMFGEIALLHNIPRSATCTTLTDCEFLVLLKEDFKSILQWTLQATWDEVLHAMSCFSYFDSLDAVSRREGCIMARLKSFARNEVILGDGHGMTTCVYFVLHGHCQMIQHLKVIRIPGLKGTHYKLYDPHIPMVSSEQTITETILKMCPQENMSESQYSVVGSKVRLAKSESRESEVVALKTPSLNYESSKNYEEEVEKRELPQNTMPNVCRNQSQAEHTRSTVIFAMDEPPKRLSFKIENRPDNLQTVYMQVCQYNPGATFGIGEDMQDRRIIALTRVECLLMPIVWLQQHNIVNIWTRIKHYLSKKLPDKKQLFKAFQMEQRWNEYKEQTVEDVVARAHVVNGTSIHDVPYSVRLEDMLDI